MLRKNKDTSNPQGTKVIQLGFNISVAGNSGTDFHVVLDDKGAVTSKPKEIQNQPITDNFSTQNKPTDAASELSKADAYQQKDKTVNKTESKQIQTFEGTLTSETSFNPDFSIPEDSTSKEFNLIDKIETTIDNFEKFSDRIKDIPRLKNCPIATSTPFSVKENSKSESNLLTLDNRQRRFTHHYSFQSRKDNFKKFIKPPPKDLFLKPLPGENFYKKRNVSKYFDCEPTTMYGSFDTLTRPNDNTSAYTKLCYEDENFGLKTSGSPLSILKKSDKDNIDRHSTSSAESLKDIKIYQSGGVIIMQNFKDPTDENDKKEISGFSRKLIENCSKLKEEVNKNFQAVEDKIIGNSSDEGKNFSKVVQFDLDEGGTQTCKIDDLSNYSPKEKNAKSDSMEWLNNYMLNKEISPQETFPSHEFTSMSTQENDSIISYPSGMFPSVSGKKLEWDSGADVGYLNLDLSKENLSAVEKIVLKGLGSDGTSEKKIVFEKKKDKSSKAPVSVIIERKLLDTKSKEQKEELKKIDENQKIFFTDKNEDQENKMSSARFSESHPDFIRTNKGKVEKKFLVERVKCGTGKRFSEDLLFSSVEKKDITAHSKQVESEDKSVNVNTLFKDSQNQLTSEIHLLDELEPGKDKLVSSRTERKAKKKVSKLKLRENVSKEKEKKVSHFKPFNKASLLDMGVPKEVNGDPLIDKLETSKSTEDIKIDQTCKVKGNVNAGKKNAKKQSYSVLKGFANRNGAKRKHRPVSASSSSNNTVLTVPESKNEKNISKINSVKFQDQKVQTARFKVESIGVQAFSSQKSSICYDVQGKLKEEEKAAAVTMQVINTNSKSIQAFGLNSSLPKQLAHPKEITCGDQNTKSTQFFGGPINSLPNYHSNIISKNQETCGRKLKVLKAKKNVDTEIIRLNEENKKNILANEQGLKINSCIIEKNIENKENVNTEPSNPRKLVEAFQTSDKREAGTCSSMKIDKEIKKEESNFREEKQCSNTSDEISSRILTSEVLKEHGESIDRDIIKEKYFKSQWIEMEKKIMVSKSTSVEKLFEGKISFPQENNVGVDVGCQCSSQGNSETAGVKEKTSKSKVKKNHKMEVVPKEKSSKHQMDKKNINLDKDFENIVSLPSSTQTALSSVPEPKNLSLSNKSAIGKTKSFEYLAGHIYENAMSLEENLRSKANSNVLVDYNSSCSSEGDASSHCHNNEPENSEGTKTLVLENTDVSSCESAPLKALNKNLAQLNIVVSKLKHKDDQIEHITQSLLLNFQKANGSGDNCGSIVLSSPSNTQELHSRCDSEVTTTISRESAWEIKNPSKKKNSKENEASIACQTEDYDAFPKKIYEDRIAVEKQNQIDWIENEIHHLNILRGILDKQDKSFKKKKKHSVLTIESESSLKNEDIYQKEMHLEGASPKPVYPQNQFQFKGKHSSGDAQVINSQKDAFRKKNDEENTVDFDKSKYGIAVSLSGNLRKVLLLPVGVKVCPKDSSSVEKKNEGTSVKPRIINELHPRLLMSSQTQNCRQVDSPYRSFCQQSTSRSDKFCTSTNPANFITASTKVTGANYFECSESNKKHRICKNCCESHQNDKEKLQNPNDKYRKEFSSRSVVESNKISEENWVSSVKSSNKSKKSAILRYCLGEDVGDENFSPSKEDSDRSSKAQSIVRDTCIKSPHFISCKCKSCVKQTTLQTSKTNTPHGPCRSNIFINCEKSPNDSGTRCRCSKVQVHKSTGCDCHVIKIHSVKCSSLENYCCPCKKKSPQKKLESQSCQTEQVIVQKKDLIAGPEIIKPKKGQEISVPCEKKIEIEIKKPAEEKFPCTPKVSIERKLEKNCNVEIIEKKIQEKTCNDIAVQAKNSTPLLECHCLKKDKKEKRVEEIDDHPRHYFLKIKEKEVEEVCYDEKQRKPLEVITVTVPFKKAGNSKLYEKKNLSNSIVRNQTKNVHDNSCHCCQEWIGRLCKTFAEEYRNHERGNCFKNSIENLESQKKHRKPLNDTNEFLDNFSCDDDNNLKTDTLKDCYDTISLDKEIPRMELSQCSSNSESQKSFIRETPSDYNSHQEQMMKKDSKAFRNCTCFEVEQTEFSRNERFKCDEGEQRPDSKNIRSQKNTRKPDQYESDFYNYDKREFLTKSELQKEERSRRVHQPSLQECLEMNRPDFYNSAEDRRRIISERSKDRIQKHYDRVECVINTVRQCYQRSKSVGEPKRIFTTAQMKEQTMKTYKKLPEVTGKIAKEKTKEEYRANKIIADVYSKKLQKETLKGHINLSNSVSVLSTI